MSNNASIISKISIGKIVGKMKAPTEKTYVMQVYGVANSSEKGISTIGEYTKLVGRFRATNLTTGEMFEAGECYLPNIALNLVLGALDGTKGVEFAFNIGIYPAENPYGYEYCCDPLMDAAENDPLAIMSKKLAALPAPDKKKKAG
mgnify:CR=1 FL=1